MGCKGTLEQERIQLQSSEFWRTFWSRMCASCHTRSVTSPLCPQHAAPDAHLPSDLNLDVAENNGRLTSERRPVLRDVPDIDAIDARHVGRCQLELVSRAPHDVRHLPRTALPASVCGSTLRRQSSTMHANAL
eukprot:2035144-Rhodomonas_salina.3